MINYRVIVKVGYREAFFDFDQPDKACNFATVAVAHQAHNGENEKKIEAVCIQVIDTDAEVEEGDDD